MVPAEAVENAAAASLQLQGLVELQVGPSLFYATRRTISKSPVLHRMVEVQEGRDASTPGKKAAALECIQSGERTPRLLLDCEPEVFSLVLSYLRTGEIDGACVLETKRSPKGRFPGGVYEHTLRQEFRLLQLPWPRRCVRCGYLYNSELYKHVSEGAVSQENSNVGQEELPLCYVHPGVLERPGGDALFYSCCGRESGGLGCQAVSHCSAEHRVSGAMQHGGPKPAPAVVGAQQASSGVLLDVQQEQDPQEYQHLQLQNQASEGSTGGGTDNTDGCKAAYSWEPSRADTREIQKEASSPVPDPPKGGMRQAHILQLPPTAAVASTSAAWQQQQRLPQQGLQQQEPCWLVRPSQLMHYSPRPQVPGNPRGPLYPPYPYASAGPATLEGENQHQQDLSLTYCLPLPQQYLAEQQAGSYTCAGASMPLGLPLCPEALWCCDYMQQQQQQQLLYCPFYCPDTIGGWDYLQPPPPKPNKPPQVAGSPGALSCETPPRASTQPGDAERVPMSHACSDHYTAKTPQRQKPSWALRRCRGKPCRMHPSACERPLQGEYSSCPVDSGDIEDMHELPEVLGTAKEGPSKGLRASVVCNEIASLQCQEGVSGSTEALEGKCATASAGAAALTDDGRPNGGDLHDGSLWPAEDAAAVSAARSPCGSGGSDVQNQQAGNSKDICSEAESPSLPLHSRSMESQSDVQQQQPDQEQQQQEHQRQKSRSNLRPRGSNPLFKTRMCHLYKNGLCHLTSRRCKFAHALRELRATSDFYKTGLCTFWSTGFCKAGNMCRHAHGEGEMRQKCREEYTVRDAPYSVILGSCKRAATTTAISGATATTEVAPRAATAFSVPGP